MKKSFTVLLLTLFLTWGIHGAYAQDQDPNPAPAPQTNQNDQASIEELKKMIDRQESVIQSLKDRLSTLEQNEKARAAQPPPPAPTISMKQPGVNAKVYGYIEATGMSNTNPLYPDVLAAPFFALSPNDPTFKKQTTGSTDFTAQYSRVGLDISAPPSSGGWKPSAKFEMDFNGSLTVSPFQDAFSRSQEAPRLRLAYARMSKDDWYFEMGEDWEAIRQNLPVVFTSEDPFLEGGEVGYRRPLLRAAYMPKNGFQVIADAAYMDALSNVDLDSSSGDIFRSGPISTRPLYELRANYVWPSSVKDKPFTLSAWGARGWEKTAAAAIQGMTDFNMKLLGADFTAPITGWFTVKGKAWTGANLADVRGGIAQGINTTTGQEIEAQGGWVQAGFGVTPHYWIWVGESVDNPNYNQLNNAPSAPFTGSNGFPLARARNSFFTLTQIWNIAPTTDFALEYFYHNTYYVNAPTGVDSEVQMSMHQNF